MKKGERREMKLRTLDEISADAKTVLVRADYNVPLWEGKITDDSRIRESLPTLTRLLGQGKKVVVATHVGRPGGKVVEGLRVDPVAGRLAELLERPVCVIREKPGKEAARRLRETAPGEVVLLENLRFYPEEEGNEERFAESLASGADAFVNEAFSVSHRAHASVVGVTKFLPAFAGLHLMEEVERLTRIREVTERPFALVLGGKKLKDKIPVVERFIGRAEVFVFGGGVGHTFARVEGWSAGRSLVDEESLERARTLLREIRASGATAVVPTDFVYEDGNGQIRSAKWDDFPGDGFAGDIGVETRKEAIRALERAKSVFWNGPLGIFEKEGFERGSLAVLEALRNLKAYRVGGGGDTLAMVNQLRMEGAFDYVSSAGGAALEFVAGKDLPGLEPLKKT